MKKIVHLFWSSWRRQTKNEGWKRQEDEELVEGLYICLHRLHVLSFSRSPFSISSNFVNLSIFLRWSQDCSVVLSSRSTHSRGAFNPERNFLIWCLFLVAQKMRKSPHRRRLHITQASELPTKIQIFIHFLNLRSINQFIIRLCQIKISRPWSHAIKRNQQNAWDSKQEGQLKISSKPEDESEITWCYQMNSERRWSDR